MQAILAEGQGLFPEHGIEGQIGIEMREQITAARGFPLQSVTEKGGINRHQQKIGLTGEMQPGRLNGLGCRREMDVTVLEIDRRALENTRHAGWLP